MSNKEIVNEYIDTLCWILNIKTPRVLYDDTLLISLGETVLAACSSDGEEIVVRNHDVDFSLLFSIAHELRHVWQIRNKPEMMSGYKVRANTDLDKYNKQAAEIDANGFAQFITRRFLNEVPTFDKQSEEVRTAINEAEKRIAKEFNLE